MVGAEAFLSAAKRWSKFEDSSGPALASIVDLARQLSNSESLDATAKRTYLVQVQQSVHALLRLDATATARQQACERVAQAATNDESGDVLATYESEAARANTAASRARPSKKAPAVMELAKLISALDGDDDELALQEDGTRITTKCPILSTPLTQPMRNAACGHVYSMTGAFQLLLTKLDKRLPRPNSLDKLPPTLKHPCPVAGCPHQFAANTIKRDFAAELTQRQRSAASAPEADAIDAIDMCE